MVSYKRDTVWFHVREIAVTMQANSDIQDAFRALADPTRRAILMQLADGEMTIGAIAERFPMTRAAIKKHLTVLEEGALISVRTAGRERLNRLEPDGLRQAADWLAYFDRFWDRRLADLGRAIAEDRK